MSDTKWTILVTITNDGNVTHKKVKLDSFIIGRHSDSDVNVLHPQVSRQHVRISLLDDVLYFEDVGSSNGTFKDGKKIPTKKAFAVLPSDTLQLGEDGPTIQIQLEEKKVNTALSKLGSLVTPVAKVVQIAEPPQAKPPEKVDEKAKEVVDSLPKLDLSTPEFATKPREEPLPILEANKEAAKILQQAQIDADEKAQQAYKLAIETEQKAEKQYQERIKQANDEAERIYEVTKKDTRALLEEARTQAQQLREKAEIDARELRKSTEEQCLETLKKAEEQAEEIKAKRLSQADEIIEKKGQDLLKSTYDQIEKQKSEAQKELKTVKEDIQSLTEEKNICEEDLKEVRKELKEIKTELRNFESDADKKKDNIEKISKDLKSIQEQFEKQKTKNSDQESEYKKTKASLEKALIELKSIGEDKELKRKEMTAELQALKEKIEIEKETLKKKEEEHTNQMKLETSEAIKKFERELIDQVISRKAELTKQIILQFEATCPSLALSDEWKNKNSELATVVQDIIGDADQASAQKALENKAKRRISVRTREKLTSMTLGLAIGALAVASADKIKGQMDGSSPIQRMVASAANKAKLDLELRKYNPKQTTELKTNYVDAVIYTQDFTGTYLNSDFQEQWTKEAMSYLLKTWRLDEDKSTKTLAMAAALVSDLSERREKIHPDFVKKDIAKMREIEKETLARMRKELGSEVRLESFKKFEKRFYSKYKRK